MRSEKKFKSVNETPASHEFMFAHFRLYRFLSTSLSSASFFPFYSLENVRRFFSAAFWAKCETRHKTHYENIAFLIARDATAAKVTITNDAKETKSNVESDFFPFRNVQSTAAFITRNTMALHANGRCRRIPTKKRKIYGMNKMGKCVVVHACVLSLRNDINFTGTSRHNEAHTLTMAKREKKNTIDLCVHAYLLLSILYSCRRRN